jgi:hypothetical protein
VRLLASCLAIGLAATFVIGADKVTDKADTPASPPQPSSKQPAKIAPAMLTPEREAAAIQFVREHHPELVDLLKGLKQTNAAQYQAAVRQLFQTSERLAKIHETDPPRYEFELSLWKIKSRIQLLAARSSMGRDPEIESQLRAALAEQAHLQLQELQMDRDRAAERLKKLDASIEQFKNNRSKNVENQFDVLMRDIDRSRQSANATAKPANAAKPEKSRTIPTTPPSAVDVQPGSRHD